MDPFLFLLALPIILLTLYFKTQNPTHPNKMHPPSPRGLPLIGHLHSFDRLSPHMHLHRLSKKHGPVMALKLGLRPLIVISSAEAVREIITSHDAAFSSRPPLASLQRLSYNGLDLAAAPYNDAYREIKKISTLHLFSARKLESFLPIFKEEVCKMITKIGIDASSSPPHVTNLSEAMMSFTSNVISRVAFGRSYGDDRFVVLLREAQPLIGGFFMEDYLPWFRWIDRISGMAGKLERSFREMDAFCEEVIEEHKDPKRPESMEGDIVDVLLRIKEDESSSFVITFNHIKALIVDIMIGGIDTSSIVMEWAMTALAKKPLLMKIVQAEIRQSAGEKDAINEHDIEKLPYLRAIVKETLRLYPPAPLGIARETTKKCSINGYEIEGGSMVFVNAWAIGRDPATWDNADEFLPERFLGTELDVGGRNPEVIPFGFGRRRCPGFGMGMAGVELALANVLYKFDWERPDRIKEEDIDFDFRPGMALHKKNALCLVAQRFVFNA